MTGTAVDISPEGELIVRLADGSLETVFSGEVSIQGFYGQTLPNKWHFCDRKIVYFSFCGRNNSNETHIFPT